MRYCLWCNKPLTRKKYRRSDSRSGKTYYYFNTESIKRFKNRKHCDYTCFSNYRQANKRTERMNNYTREQRKRWDKTAKDRNKRKIMEYLLTHPCVDCGNNNPIVLQFDHLRDKWHEVGFLVVYGYSWQSVEKEIAKCVVRCANCHQIKTSREMNHYKYQYVTTLEFNSNVAK